MTSFYYNYQNPWVCCFFVQIKAIVLQYSAGLTNLNNKAKPKWILVVLVKYRHRAIVLLPLPLNFYVRTHVNLTRVNKIQTMFDSWRWDVHSKVRGYFCWILARFKTFLVKSILITLQQKERDRQRSAAKKLIHNNSVPEKKNNRKVSGTGENRGEFDDLISALRTGDVFGDELSKMKGRRRTAPPKQARRVENVSERERASPKIATKF